MYKTSVFIFHRDLSIEDNRSLFECLTDSDRVFLMFIFTPQQADPKINDYFSQNSFSFMLNSLRELSKQVYISFLYADTKEAIAVIIDDIKPAAIWESADFSPFAKKRQQTTKNLCDKSGVKYHLCDTITLTPMGSFLRVASAPMGSLKTGGGAPYLKFTPFYSNAVKKSVARPLARSVDTGALQRKIAKVPARSGAHSGAHSGRWISLDKFKTVHKAGGRKEALALLDDFAGRAAGYEKGRNYMAAGAVSNLSPHLHFGTLSPREVFHKLKKHTEFIKQLYWREFYMYIVNYVAITYEKKSWTLRDATQKVWKSAPAKLKAWQNGKTGVPIVDAGMRQLLTTGFMHNRSRMICAMYLIHYLKIHWKEGEKWFAQNLKDYSYANNYGGWTWTASTEVYSNPSFRIYSMKRQHERFDPDSKYVKLYCSEYKNMSHKEILQLYNALIREK